MRKSSCSILQRFFSFTFAFLLSFTLSLKTYGQDALGTTTDNKAVDKEAQPDQVWKLDLGYMIDFNKDAKNSYYYALKYQGQSLAARNEAFQEAHLGSPISAPGDSKNVYFRLEHGTATAKGGIFDALGVRPLHLSGFLRDLRGAAQITGTADFDQLHLSAGLETPAYHLIGKRAGFTNWLIFGFAGEQQLRSQNSGDDKDVALATYRSFLGKAFGWERNAEEGQKASKLLVQGVLERAKTFEEAEAYLHALRDSDNTPDSIDSFIDLAVPRLTPTLKERDSPSFWQQAVEARATPLVASSSWHPTSALWLESAGWYPFNRTNDTKHRFNHMFTATYTWWFSPERKDSQILSIRYEFGRERGAPEVRRDQLMFTLGAAF